MKLLIVTQAVDLDNPILGFFHGWIKEFSKKFESIVVICLEKGKHDLSDNVKVLSLGKENKKSRIMYIWNFYRYIWQERKNYDAVFVHMNQEYVLLGGIVWKILRKKILMWRNHFAGTWLTSLASHISDIVYYTSPYSYTARFKNAVLMPVGIDINLFSPTEKKPLPHSILFVGRMSPVKKPDILLDALHILIRKGVSIQASFYGKPAQEHRMFYEEMIRKVASFGKEQIHFPGAVKNTALPDIYRDHEILINLSPDGMFDKGIFEALACGVLVIVSNSAFSGILSQDMLCHNPTSAALANSIEDVLNKKDELRKNNFREYVVRNHSLDMLCRKVRDNIEKI